MGAVKQLPQNAKYAQPILVHEKTSLSRKNEAKNRKVDENLSYGPIPLITKKSNISLALPLLRLAIILVLIVVRSLLILLRSFLIQLIPALAL